MNKKRLGNTGYRALSRAKIGILDTLRKVSSLSGDIDLTPIKDASVWDVGLQNRERVHPEGSIKPI